MLNENIKTIRKNKGFTQEELATRLHVTRQTVSKWEKGLSVPDADMLCHLAEALDVSVADLLGADRVEREQMDAVVEQLCRINEQLAIKNRRSRRIWKAVIIAAIVFIVIPAVITISSAIAYTHVWNSNEFGTGEPLGTTNFTCIIDGEEHTYQVKYDENYDILSYGNLEDDYFDDRIDFFGCKDANEWAERFQNYVVKHDGQISEIETKGITLESVDLE